MVSLAKPRGDRIVLYNFNREIICNKSKELFQLKAIIAEVKMDLTLPINRGWKITKSFSYQRSAVLKQPLTGLKMEPHSL